MRLLDRIFSYGFETVLEGIVDEALLLRDLTMSQLVVIDNVADYSFSQGYSKGRDYAGPVLVTDFPNVMLPFELSFFEARFSSQISTKTGNVEEVGAFLTMQAARKREDRPDWWLLDQPGVKYHLTALCFIRRAGQKRPGLLVEIVVPVDGNGQIVSPDGQVQIVTHLLFKSRDQNDKDAWVGFTHHFLLHPICLALSFMHCQNVRVREEIPPAKLSKSYQKKRGRPLLRYHILQIDHMKQVLEREGGASTGGLKKALHICRGHFATYGKEGKGLLFGKLSGRYWIPMHARGNADCGIVAKDYQVK